MAVTGDFAKLSKLAAAFKTLGDENLGLMRKCSETAVRFNRGNFNSKQSPHGESWVSGPSYNGLRKSGKLAAGFKGRYTSSSFGLRNAVRYAWYHQTGVVLRGKAFSGPLRQTPMSGPLQPRKRRKFQTDKRQRLERGKLPARPIVPSYARGIPTAWQPGLDHVVLDHYTRKLKV